MMLEKKIKLINQEASLIREASIAFYSEIGNFIILICINEEKKKFVSSDYFGALSLLREYLYNEYKSFPNLIGALKSVYPSRMSRQMSRGLTAYNHVMGKQAKEKDLVNIFDQVDESEYQNLVSVEEQRSTYKTWLKSL